ncbi:uncharacterized protein LOC127243891 isoform X2 [Andrographis paniculata]|uniref:uncharacterized protein LOC127243891 isoform X2 n=1 Tax=Andrographis paniculata TaxID=175694 RepID=UPI0021E882CA|nr:uncharacterized protein LOC127243891 isoform X2 [Andrographis paniculata]
MAGATEGGDAGFWLPPEFLTDDDFLIDKQIFNRINSDTDFVFPTEFPYELVAVPAAPPRAAPYFGTCAGNGRPNAGLSSPLTARYDAVGDLIYRNRPAVRERNDRFALPRYHMQGLVHNEGGGAPWSYSRPSRGMVLQPGRERAVLCGGGAAEAKKACAGTGVFLPRRYSRDGEKPHWADARRKTGCSPVVFPSPSSAGSTDVFSWPQPSHCIFAQDYDNWMAMRKHAALLQQQRQAAIASSAAVARVPHEWTY